MSRVEYAACAAPLPPRSGQGGQAALRRRGGAGAEPRRAGGAARRHPARPPARRSRRVRRSVRACRAARHRPRRTGWPDAALRARRGAARGGACRIRSCRGAVPGRGIARTMGSRPRGAQARRLRRGRGPGPCRRRRRGGARPPRRLGRRRAELSPPDRGGPRAGSANLRAARRRERHDRLRARGGGDRADLDPDFAGLEHSDDHFMHAAFARDRLRLRPPPLPPPPPADRRAFRRRCPRPRKCSA